MTVDAVTPSAQWFFMNQGVRNGPLGEEDLIREVGALPDPGATLVWRAGLEGWIPAKDVGGLAARFSAPAVSPLPAAAATDKPLDRPGEIAGWLVLPALGLIGALVLDTIELLKSLVSFFKSFGVDTPYATIGALFEMAIVGVLLAFEAAVAAFFFRKHRWGPRVYILFLLSRLALMALYMFIHQLEPQPETADAPKELTRAVVGAMVWIPYFLVSRRVKLTFTR